MGSDIVKHHDYIYCMVVSFPVSSICGAIVTICMNFSMSATSDY